MIGYLAYLTVVLCAARVGSLPGSSRPDPQRYRRAIHRCSQAKRRLADEYDAAQARGEVASQSRGGANIANGVPGGNTVATVSDIGLTRKQVHEARQLRDAEAADPGVIRRTLDARLADGQ